MKQKLRMILLFFLVADLCLVGYMVYHYVDDSIPDYLMTYVGEEEEIELPSIFDTEETVEALSVKNHSGGFSMLSEETGEYQVPVKLFGVVPVKNVDVKVIRKMKVAPSGQPIGIYVETNGLLVLDTAEIEGRDGLTYAPGENVLKAGDYILKWDETPVATIRDLNEEIQRTKDKKVSVLLRRNGEQVKVAVCPILATDRTYKIGTWVREDTQGIGTLTYVTEEGKFGTLGHGITDVDTGTLLNLHGGELFQTKILDITRGTKGEPGELQGYINMVATNEIGQISRNTDVGVFGKMESDRIEEYAGDFVSVGMKQDIKEGKAYIHANLEGKPRKYEIQIEEINLNSMDNKSMEIRVTDSRLLQLTGGIVQGMSGSPIIQDGKLVGAVTHVLVDDPSRGYGVFIETMLSQQK
ncbi:MAG: SpoIVB peptidase [Eubacterium sp.]|nr:SpoIVB peptidase [Eubacterium sp.]